MNRKETKNGIKTLVSLVIAFTMITMAMPMITTQANDNGSDPAFNELNMDVRPSAFEMAAGGAMPPSPGSMSRTEDNRHLEENSWYDPYAGTRGGQVPPDVDVTYLDEPDPTIPHDSSEQMVIATVTNWDDEPHNVTLALQVYEETAFQPEIDWYDNMELCCVNWTAYENRPDWAIIDAENYIPTDLYPPDGLTWSRTELRYDSPTHSWRSTTCDRATYAGMSDDWLISKPVKIPDWEVTVWANFSTWIQGELGNVAGSDYWKFEDYLAFYVEVYNETTGNWSSFLVDKYVDTGGEWAYPETLEAPRERLDIWGAQYEQWNCTKGSGAPWQLWGGINLEQYFLDVYNNPSPAERTVRFAFRWVSDPCHNFEGAYIDDFQLLSSRSGKQELVDQQYKPVDHPLSLGAFNASGDPFQKMVQFHLPFTPKDGMVYFFEVYSVLQDADDVDGERDYMGSWEVDTMTGATYWDPLNGVNESVWFGDYHDGMVVYIDAPAEVELQDQQCSEQMCETIPIEVRVTNNGTVAEEIPVQVSAKLKIEETIFENGFEAGPADPPWEEGGLPGADWGQQGSFFGFSSADDAAPDFYPHYTDMDTYSGVYHLLVGDARAFLGANMAQGFNTLISGDSDTTEGFVANGNELNVIMRYAAKWKFDSEGSGNFFDDSTAIYDIPFDGWAPVMEDSIANAILGRFPSTTLGYKVTGHSNDQWYAPGSPGPYKSPYDVEPTGSKYSKSLFEIDWLPTMDYYAGLGYRNIEYGFIIITDESGMPDLAAPGDLWSGLMIDDFSVTAEYPGATVWESEIQSVFLEPGESATLDFEWDACEFSFYVLEARTLVEGDCNKHNDAQATETYLHHILFDDDIEDVGEPVSQSTYGAEYDKYWSTEDNTAIDNTPSDFVSICSTDACEWNDDHFWYFGNGNPASETNYNYPPYADIILQMLNITDDGALGGPNKDGAFNLSAMANAQLDFNLWWQMEWEYYIDYFTIEVSPNSGLDWYLYDFYHTSTNWQENEEIWHKISYDLFNISTGQYFYAMTGYDPILGPLGAVNLSDPANYTLDEVHFRFHLLSNGGWEEKGVYLDDVYLNTTSFETKPYNGNDKPYEWIHEILFQDDMEDADASEMKWMSFDGSPTGDLWHVTTLHNPHSPTHKWWAGDEKDYSSYGKDLYQDFYNYGYSSVRYLSDPMMYRQGMENNLTLTLPLGSEYQAFLEYYENYSFADTDDYGILYISDDGGETWNAVGGTASVDSNGWIKTTVDLTQFLPNEEPLLIRWSFMSGYATLPAGWDINDEGDQIGDSWEISPPGLGCNGSQYAAKLPIVWGPDLAAYPGVQAPMVDEWLESNKFTYPDFTWQWGWYSGSDANTTIDYIIKYNDPGNMPTQYNVSVYMMSQNKVWVEIDNFDLDDLPADTCVHRQIILDDMDPNWLSDSWFGSPFETRIAFRVQGNSGLWARYALVPDNPMIYIDNVTVTGPFLNIDNYFAGLWYEDILAVVDEDFETTDIGWEIDDILVKAKSDCIEPITTVILNPASPDGCNDWYTDPVTITLTAIDNREDALTTYYRINGGSWLTYTGPVTINNDGEFTIDYYSVDAVGNVEATQSVSFKIDTTAPTGSLNMPQAGYIYLFGRELMPRILNPGTALIIGGLTATASASDSTSGVSHVTFSTGQGSMGVVSPYQFNLPFYFPFGSDTLTISITDNACNTASNVASVDYFKIL